MACCSGRFERPAVEREELLPGLDVFTLLEVDRGELAGDLRADRHRGKGLDGADDAHFERHVLADCGGGRDGHSGRRCVLLRLDRLALRTGRGRECRAQQQPDNATGGETHDGRPCNPGPDGTLDHR